MFNELLIYVGSFLISGALEVIGLELARKAAETETLRGFAGWEIDDYA